MKTKNNITTFEEILDKKYGKRGNGKGINMISKNIFIMNKFYLSFLLTITNICYGYSQGSNRVYFVDFPNSRKIVVPVQLNDNLFANMTFDTGNALDYFSLDSIFASVHSDRLAITGLPAKMKHGSGWAGIPVTALYYSSPRTVTIGKSNLIYNSVLIYDYKRTFGANKDGLFNIPQNTTQVWELNFENNYLDIHSATDFKMPEDCFLFPFEKSEEHPYPFNVRIPIQISYSDGDTLTIDRLWMIDTGMTCDIALLSPAEELEFFNKKNDAVWLRLGRHEYMRRYAVNAASFEGFLLDSLHIYTFDYFPRDNRVKYLLGLNFLKRFNVFFDLKNNQLGLQPIDNFCRLVDIDERYYLTIQKTSDEKRVIERIADFPGNYYYEAGLRNGDELVKVEGLKSLYEGETPQDSLTFKIIRSGNPMEFRVPVFDDNPTRGWIFK